MELSAVVKHQGALAYYTVLPENQGIYHARLVRYYGSPDSAPPERLLLVKGVRRWLGSCERQDLLDDIGHIIESRIPTPERVSRTNSEPTNPVE
jgi:hypothetical protein